MRARYTKYLLLTVCCGLDYKTPHGMLLGGRLFVTFQRSWTYEGCIAVFSVLVATNEACTRTKNAVMQIRQGSQHDVKIFPRTAFVCQGSSRNPVDVIAQYSVFHNRRPVWQNLQCMLCRRGETASPSVETPLTVRHHRHVCD